MKPLSPDTTVEAQRMHYELMSRLPPERRLELALELTDNLRQFVIEDIKSKYPDADEATIKRRFAARVLKREEVIRVYGFDPLDEIAE
jgi:hypothetical protein